MADLMQLDKAASLVGKSEVTLRRLIKAGKIPFQKEKTLTGFIYRVDPEEVLAYYHIRGGGVFNDEGKPAAEPEPEKPGPTYMPKSPDPVRIAVEDEDGHAAEYWQKRSDLYEDKYHQEVQKHAQTREELGMWRGRAEQVQAMVIRMLPSPETPATPVAETTAKPKEDISWMGMVISVLVTLLVCGGIAFYVYGKYFAGR